MPIKQESTRFRKRWFGDRNMDLFIWEWEDGSIYAFQLCYDKLVNERALSWSQTNGFSHEAVDDGEAQLSGYKASPLLLPDGVFDWRNVRQQFLVKSQHLDAFIVACITGHLRAFGEAEW